MDTFYGTIVSSSWGRSRIQHIIYVGPGRPLHFVARPDPPEVEYNALSREEKKIRDKEERARHLEFGDCIRFVSNRMGGLITEYEKTARFSERRSYDGTNQLLTSLVFRKVNGEMRAESLTYGEVDVPTKFQDAFLVDVAYDCWVSVTVRRHDMSVAFSLYSFATVCLMQNDVPNMHWNIHDERFFRFNRLDDIDEDFGRDKPPYFPPIADRLVNISGVALSDREVYCPSLKKEKVLLAYVSPERAPLEVGTRLSCDVLRAPYVDAHIVTAFWSLNKELVEQRIFDSHDGRLSVKSQWNTKLPFGYFWSWNLVLGVIHDPHGLAVPLFLSKQTRRKKYHIDLVDAGSNFFSRYAIASLSHSSAIEVRELALKDDSIKHLDGKAIVLGEGRVLLPRYSTLLVHFTPETVPSNWAELKPGEWISIEADMCADMRTFTIRSWASMVGCAPVEASFATEEVGYAFKSVCEWNRLLGVFESKEFGFVDDPNWIVKWEEKQRQSPPTRRNQATPEVECQPPITLWLVRGEPNSRTPLIVYSKNPPGMEEPVDEEPRTAEFGLVFTRLTL